MIDERSCQLGVLRQLSLIDMSVDFQYKNPVKNTTPYNFGKSRLEEILIFSGIMLDTQMIRRVNLETKYLQIRNFIFRLGKYLPIF
jgi:hypothetical protein